MAHRFLAVMSEYRTGGEASLLSIPVTKTGQTSLLNLWLCTEKKLWVCNPATVLLQVIPGWPSSRCGIM